MGKYIKTGTTEFEQFDGTKQFADRFRIIRYRGHWYCPTIEGDLHIAKGDWIATGVEGEHWPVKDEIFQKTYKKLPTIPMYVADYIEKCKANKMSIAEALASEYRPEKMQDWLGLDEEKMHFSQEQYNQRTELVARAWLDGYEVEE